MKEFCRPKLAPSAWSERFLPRNRTILSYVSLKIRVEKKDEICGMGHVKKKFIHIYENLSFRWYQGSHCHNVKVSRHFLSRSHNFDYVSKFSQSSSSPKLWFSNHLLLPFLSSLSLTRLDFCLWFVRMKAKVMNGTDGNMAVHY